MQPSPRRLLRNRTAYAAVIVAIALSMPMASLGALGDDIPHENYDLVGTNLDFVISLLRSSITYSEYALMGMYNESMSNVDQNLTIVREVLIPAERLLAEIRDVAGSYENLSMLLPPFADLSTQMDSFASMEKSLIQSRDDILSAAQLEDLTGDQLLRALEAIRTVNSLINRMNETIDGMLVSANSIIALEVDGERPFTDNQLIPLIELLRGLLHRIQTEIDYTIINDIPWTSSLPFLLFWLSSSEYFLDERIIGGGYLFYDGAFVGDHVVTVEMDGTNLTAAQTSSAGIYVFAYQIPLNSSWLGSHTLRATTSTPNGTLNSTSLQIEILLLPTTLSLDVPETQVSPDAEVLAFVKLEDVRGNPVASVPCHLNMDLTAFNFNTNAEGEHESSWLASDLGFGAHSIQAFFDGVLPYAPSSSVIMDFEVNIPTSIDLHITSARIFLGYYLVGDGALISNETQGLPDQTITLSVDGIAVDNVTTDSIGQFSFSIPTEGLAVGSHTLKAQFLNRDIIWRYSEEELGFTIYGKKQVKYPFFPSIPGWGGLGPPDTFVYLFIGPNSYYFWLLVLLFAGIMVKTYQISSKRRMTLAKQRAQVTTTIEEAPERAPAPTAEEFALELGSSREGPISPNERIVWYYQRLLSFLTRRDSLPFRTSMTHWEVARLMKTFGYPSAPVEKATMLFEMALYSGEELADTDMVVMSATLTSLIGMKKREVPDGV